VIPAALIAPLPALAVLAAFRRYLIQAQERRRAAEDRAEQKRRQAPAGAEVAE
jgi:hypothetical protein